MKKFCGKNGEFDVKQTCFVLHLELWLQSRLSGRCSVINAQHRCFPWCCLSFFLPLENFGGGGECCFSSCAWPLHPRVCPLIFTSWFNYICGTGLQIQDPLAPQKGEDVQSHGMRWVIYGASFFFFFSHPSTPLPTSLTPTDLWSALKVLFLSTETPCSGNPLHPPPYSSLLLFLLNPFNTPLLSTPF